MATHQSTRSGSERESMKRSDATTGLETTVKPGTAVESYQAINDDTSIHEQIAAMAYDLYLQRAATGGPGSPEEDWYRAEAQFRASRPRTSGTDI